MWKVWNYLIAVVFSSSYNNMLHICWWMYFLPCWCKACLQVKLFSLYFKGTRTSSSLRDTLTNMKQHVLVFDRSVNKPPRERMLHWKYMIIKRLNALLCIHGNGTSLVQRVFLCFFYRSVWWLQVNSNAVPVRFAFLYAVLPFWRKAITEIHVCHNTECVGLYRCTNALAEWSLFDLFLPRPSLRQYVITRCTSITSYVQL